MGFYASSTLETAPAPSTTTSRRSVRNQNPLRGPIRGVVSGYRYYSPELGRWPSRDPIHERGFRIFAPYIVGEIFGQRGYAFVDNAPLHHHDVLGLASCDTGCTPGNSYGEIVDTHYDGGDYTGASQFHTVYVNEDEADEAAYFHCSCEREDLKTFVDIQHWECMAATIYCFDGCEMTPTEGGQWVEGPFEADVLLNENDLGWEKRWKIGPYGTGAGGPEYAAFLWLMASKEQECANECGSL